VHPGIGFIMAAFTERKQALHDQLAGTLVVKKYLQPSAWAFAIVDESGTWAYALVQRSRTQLAHLPIPVPRVHVRLEADAVGHRRREGAATFR
jgi:hypothetical protein